MSKKCKLNKLRVTIWKMIFFGDWLGNLTQMLSRAQREDVVWSLNPSPQDMEGNEKAENMPQAVVEVH